MKIARTIQLHIGADLKLAITLARIDVFHEVKASGRYQSPLSEDTIKSISMIGHIGTGPPGPLNPTRDIPMCV